MRRAVTFHPILFALFPILSLYAANLAIVPIEDTYRAIGIVLGSAMLLWLVLFAIVRDWKRSGMAVSVAIILFFAFGYVWAIILNNYTLWSWFWPKEKFQTIWIALIACLGVFFAWKWRFAPRMNTAFNWIGVVLVAMPLYTITSAWYVRWRDSTGLEVAAASTKSNAAPLGKPDIFYVILDGYGREDALKQFLGFDNSSFVDQLKQRGFYVADQSHSNYCQTELSLASSLNMDFLQNNVSKEAQQANDRNVVDTMIDRNGVAKYLKQKGYEYEAITSGAPNIRIKTADIHVQDEAKVTLFESTLMQNTPLGAPKNKMSNYLYDNRRSHLLSSLTLLERAGNPTAKPRFVFVHILAPHPPFVVGPTGESITPAHPFSFEDGTSFYDQGGTPAEYQAGYLGQLRYLNKRVVQCVDEIIRQEHTPPIIILQGDHGSKKGWNPESLTKTNVREVYRNLNAYYVPAAIGKQLYPSITPVNSFRTILDTLFADNMPKLPDNAYFSTITKPLEFTPVSAAAIEAR